MITIINYGMGNLGSIANMIKGSGHSSEITSEISKIESAKKIILPGVGHFDKAMQNFVALGLLNVIRKKALEDKTPMLGICLGMQIMCKNSEEGKEEGFGLIDAEVKKFSFSENQKQNIPHMGWNTIDIIKPNPLISYEEEEQRFYFVHSYHTVCNNQQDVLATTHHGYEITAAFSRDNIFGVQFHPEKSHHYGLALIKKFIEL